MSTEIQLVKFKRDKETKEESLIPFFIYEDRVQCLYKDRNGVFIVDKQGYTHKVPHTMEEMVEVFRL